MKPVVVAIALVATLSAPAAQAAQDPGLTLHDTRGGERRLGLGARASLTIPLGATRAQAQRAVVSFDAGPAVTRAGDTLRVRDRFRVAPLTRLAIRPGYDAEWSLARQPVVQLQSPAAIRDSRVSLPEGERKNMSTLGKVGIAVGVAALAAGIALLVLIDEANDRSD